MQVLKSRLMTGWVRHRRHTPKAHHFRYPVFMSWLMLDELEQVAARSRFWSIEQFNCVSYYRKDYLGNPETGIYQSIQEIILQQTGNLFNGRIALLTHLRCLGYAFNPVSFYFCYPEQAEQPRYILAEINNTPWDERYTYLLDTHSCAARKSKFDFTFKKQFHVSPFFPMDMGYQWRFALQPNAVTIHMRLVKAQQQCFDATLQLSPVSMNSKTMRSIPLRYPLMSVAVVLRIYWQALILWLKRIPFHEHPKHQKKPHEENFS